MGRSPLPIASRQVLEVYRETAVESLLRRVDSRGTARKTVQRHTRRNVEQWRRDPVAAAEIEAHLKSNGGRRGCHQCRSVRSGSRSLGSVRFPDVIGTEPSYRFICSRHRAVVSLYCGKSLLVAPLQGNLEGCLSGSLPCDASRQRTRRRPLDNLLPLSPLLPPLLEFWATRSFLLSSRKLLVATGLDGPGGRAQSRWLRRSFPRKSRRSG